MHSIKISGSHIERGSLTAPRHFFCAIGYFFGGRLACTKSDAAIDFAVLLLFGLLRTLLANEASFLPVVICSHLYQIIRRNDPATQDVVVA